MRYHNITKDDMLNGSGLRVVLWLAGCSHRCPGCHNPVTWNEEGGLVFDQAAKKELFDQLKQDYTAGITFSGGDPLHPANRPEVLALAAEIKETFPHKNIWLYTGYDWEDIKTKPGIGSLDVIVDGKFIADKKDTQLHWRGSSNQRVIDVRKSLTGDSVILYNE